MTVPDGQMEPYHSDPPAELFPGRSQEEKTKLEEVIPQIHQAVYERQTTPLHDLLPL